MNYYRNISEKIEIDFATHDVKDFEYKREIESKGNKVYVFPKIKLSTFREICKKIDRFFEQHNDYDIIHCNMANAAIIYFYFAKKYGNKIRILHSHQNKYADSFFHSLRNIPLVFAGKLLTTSRIACSKEAGEFLFKNKEFTILKNAIQIKNFEYNLEKRKKIREKLQISDEEYLIGNIGRLTEQKNQKFLIQVFKKVYEQEKNAKLLIIGEGHLKEKLAMQSEDMGLKKEIIFLESTDKINEYMQAIDVFVLPSLYEGVGIVNIEAQAAGLHTIVSERVPKEAKVTEDLIEYISLNDDIKIWSETILKYNNNYKRTKYTEEIASHGYNIENEAHKLEKIYEGLVKIEKKGK